MIELQSSCYQSPIGGIRILTHNGRICYLDFDDNPERMSVLLTKRFGNYGVAEASDHQASDHQECHTRLDRYFSGSQDAFEGVETDTGGTDFQREVWSALTDIPQGETLDYSALAARAGNAKAVRAAASSNARNPVSIIIPCHRVIGKDGSLRGYAGGEKRKRWLLEHEGAWQRGVN